MHRLGRHEFVEHLGQLVHVAGVDHPHVDARVAHQGEAFQNEPLIEGAAHRIDVAAHHQADQIVDQHRVRDQHLGPGAAQGQRQMVADEPGSADQKNPLSLQGQGFGGISMVLAVMADTFCSSPSLF